MKKEEQWAEYSALWDSGSIINLSGLLPFDDYNIFRCVRKLAIQLSVGPLIPYASSL